MRRRAFLEQSGMAAATVALAGGLGQGVGAAAQALDANALVIDPAPTFELSPYLYMQFMEPLGATDGSVEAAWDHLAEQWRDDVVAVTRELAPPMMRWGGIFAERW
jgi:alpha-L-arabinofuranosidase